MAIESIINLTGNLVARILEFMSILCIAIGFIASLYLLFKTPPGKVSPLHWRMRLKFGGWLALALEFQLGSDIVSTTLSPSYSNLIMLGAVAIIRTFLNYFLSRELKEEMQGEYKSQPVAYTGLKL